MQILLDLDGTLTDSRPGIVASMRSALAALGLESPSDDELTRYIGPPTHRAFPDLLASVAARARGGDAKPDPAAVDPVLLERAVALYRERFGRVGLFENSVYPGMRDTLEALVRRGDRLWVATSKPLVYAQAIIEHYELRRYFVAVYGSELNGERGDKGELIGYLLAREGLSRPDTWMVGDRSHDVVGAHKHGVRAAGVLWGYGTRPELEAAGADVVIPSVRDLLVVLA